MHHNPVVLKKIAGALHSARASHPDIDYAGFVSSIAKRVSGALFAPLSLSQPLPATLFLVYQTDELCYLRDAEGRIAIFPTQGAAEAACNANSEVVYFTL